jgi:hypothetical protein
MTNAPAFVAVPVVAYAKAGAVSPPVAILV